VNREIWPFPRSSPIEARRRRLGRAAAVVPASLLLADVLIASAVLIIAIASMSASGRNARAIEGDQYERPVASSLPIRSHTEGS
jgi:hypothetical protein